MIDLEVLLVFFLIKLYFEKKFNVFENIYIVLYMDEWINKYVFVIVV